MIEVVRAGLATTIQDRGRPGWAHLGVGRSGAADGASLRLANRLVGNAEGDAAFESSGGLQLRIGRTTMVAITGATCDVRVSGGIAVGPGSPATVPAGATLSLGPARGGLRTYVAVRGGLAVAVVLGSRSRDTLGNLGPEIADGDVLDVGEDPGTAVATDLAPQRPWPTEIGIMPGPRRDWFTHDAWAVLTAQAYAVGTATNRVGARLIGRQPLQRAQRGELPSEGIVLGAVQVPPDGQPIVMLADHPVTGGYPVIAVVVDASLGAVAQAAPGTELRFRSTTT